MKRGAKPQGPSVAGSPGGVAAGAGPVEDARAWVAVAEVARPHGITGELRLRVYNADSDLLARPRVREGAGRGAATFPPVRLRLRDGAVREAVIESARPVPGAILARLVGVADRDAAEALRGAEIVVPRDAFAPLEEGEFYACDIEGARAVLRSGGDVGRVKGIRSYPTCDALLVEREGKGLLEVPLVDAYVGSVDAAGGVVEIVTLDGLE